MPQIGFWDDYDRAKASCGDAVLLMRCGDFYEAFDEDADIIIRVLGLTRTSRERKTEGRVTMAGFPHHQCNKYLMRLVKAGYRVAVSDYIDDDDM